MLFDDYIMVDWSAKCDAEPGANSVWVAHQSGAVLVACNPATRREAMEFVAEKLLCAVSADRRVLLGFDFAFGCPAGTAKAMGLTPPVWKALWEKARADIRDDQPCSNMNNSFEVAERWRKNYGLPFYGKHPSWDRYPELPVKDCPPSGCQLPRKRKTEQGIGASSVWGLFGGPNVVGRQSLTGIPRLWDLRFDSALKDAIVVWPFETGFIGEFAKNIVLVEIYPGISEIRQLTERHDGCCKDEKEVKAACAFFSRLDKEDGLRELFSPSISADDAGKSLEEGWILGAQGA